MRGIYYGLPVDNYQVLYVANNQQESEQIEQDPQMQQLQQKHSDIHGSETATWKDFL